MYCWKHENYGIKIKMPGLPGILLRLYNYVKVIKTSDREFPSNPVAV